MERREIIGENFSEALRAVFGYNVRNSFRGSLLDALSSGG
jgi:hypothetical protein